MRLGSALVAIMIGCATSPTAVVPETLRNYRSLEKFGDLSWGMTTREVKEAFPSLSATGTRLVSDVDEESPLIKSRTAFHFAAGKLALVSYAALCASQEQVRECFDLFRGWEERLTAHYGGAAERNFDSPSLNLTLSPHLKFIPHFSRAEHKRLWTTSETLIALTHDGLAQPPTLSLTVASRVLMDQLAREPESTSEGTPQSGRNTR